MSVHEPWMDVAGQERFSILHVQTLEEFIEGQHSRETWARARMGPQLTASFDGELRALLTPYAPGGLLRFTVASTLTWGRPRAERKS